MSEVIFVGTAPVCEKRCRDASHTKALPCEIYRRSPFVLQKLAKGTRIVGQLGELPLPSCSGAYSLLDFGGFCRLLITSS